LEEIAEKEFGDIIKSTDFIGGKASAPNKLRIFFIDNSFLDVWLSKDGEIHRWDNAPDHPELHTFPKHFHNGSDKDAKESELDEDYDKAIRDVLGFIQRKLAEYM
jgi:hypothetical protein